MASVVTLVTQEGHAAVTDAIRLVLARLREAIVAGQVDDSQLALALAGWGAQSSGSCPGLSNIRFDP